MSKFIMSKYHNIYLVQEYEYFDINFDTYLNFNSCDSKIGSRALSSFIAYLGVKRVVTLNSQNMIRLNIEPPSDFFSDYTCKLQ